MRDRRIPHGDEGASLILVLVFVATFGLTVPALLSRAETSVRSVSVTRDVAAASYDAESGTDLAINRLRTGTFYNAPGQPCFHDPADTTGATDSSALVVSGAGTNTGNDVLVTCQPSTDTGYPTSIKVPITNANRPGQALLTLSRTQTGITHDKNNVLRIQGRVFSNSGVTVSNNNAELRVSNAALVARGACSGPITAVPTSCNDTTQDALGVDPSYALPGTTPSVVAVPSCSGATGISLSPGTYTDAAALSALTNSCRALVQFTPGTYYFDFAATAPVWSITDGYVIGGSIPTQAGRAWTLAGYPGTVPTVPGACVTPTESTTNGGVKFIFGGASRMTVSGGGKVELCGQYQTTSPPIAVFGANAGAGSSAVTRTVTTDGVAPNGTQDFANQPRLQVKDASTSDAAVIGKNASQSTSTLTANLPLTGTAVPAGATLTSATLRVTHQDQVGPQVKQGNTTYIAGPVTSLAVGVLPTNRPNGDNTYRAPATQPVIGTALHEDALDVTAALKADFDARGFAGLSVTYTAGAAVGTAATEKADSILLDLVYSTPGFRTTQNACAGAPCTIITANGSQPTTQLYVQGTTYTPFSRLDITLNNVSAQVFKFGLIADTVRVALTGSSSFAEAVIAVPDTSPAFDTVQPALTTLQAYVCDRASCPAPPVPAPAGYVPTDSGWVRTLSAQVRLVDTAYPPTAGLRQIDLVSWFHPRT